MLLRILTSLCVVSLLFVNSAQAKRFDYKFCIERSSFIHLIEKECNTLRIKKSLQASPVQRREVATSFLFNRFFNKRYQNSEPSRITTYHEECCHEGCTSEEIYEYC
ncbi:hypothetical protein AC249_AIPGENE2813 [Exaiptasia diaphana]|nr:hypothetical protein AC249_AIPGENE2834 [Exaiptasia diaphana]KXJ15183.1 hypothetical protein AC249_AIPGENE2813 [Exaiptasia diaphana]